VAYALLICAFQVFLLAYYGQELLYVWHVVTADEGAEEEGEDENVAQYHKLMMPQLIVSLDASDEFVRQRVMNLPESVVVGTHNTEDGLTRRLAEYRSVNTDDDTVLNYFDELELHPEHIGQTAAVTVTFRLHFLFLFVCSFSG